MPQIAWPSSIGLGRIIAFLVLVAVFVLAIMGRMSGLEVWLFAGLATAILLV